MKTQVYRIVRLLLLLSLVVVGSGIPVSADLRAAPAADDGEAPLAVEAVEHIMLDNEIETSQFGGGIFRRTALSAKVATKVAGNDLPGAIQLMPIGALTEFEVINGRLPVKIADMGVVTMGNYLIIIGGNKRVEKNGFITYERTNEVWIGEVDTTTGMPPLKSAWVPDSPLPAVQTSAIDGLMGDDVAELSYPAVVGIPDSPGSSDGYIYVVGGLVEPPGLTDKTSSAAVHVGRFENGSISWIANASPLLPNPDLSIRDIVPSYGIHGAEMQAVEVGNKTYLYVLGGLQNYLEESVLGSPYIFYAEMGSDGKPKHPETGDPGWAVMRQKDSDTPILIPSPEGAPLQDAGLWFASSVVYVGIDDAGRDQDPAIFLFAGQRRTDDVKQVSRYSKTIHRGMVQDDGRITWDWQGNLSQNPLTNLEAISYQQNVYLPGGMPMIFDEGQSEWSSDTEYQEVLSNFINEELEPDAEIGFRTNDMKRSRQDHGVSIIPATPAKASDTTLAYFYVVAGRSDTNPNTGKGTDPDDEYSNYATDTLLFSRIDPDDATPIYSTNGGWYYSRNIDVSKYNNPETNKTDMVGVTWSAAVSRTTEITSDIRLEYRIDNLGCDNPKVFGDADSSQWRTLTRTLELTTTEQAYFSQGTGNNSVDMQESDRQDKIACFQYRAQLMTAHKNYTPLLLNVGINILTDKKPDLWVEEIAPQKSDTGNQFVGLDVTLQNLFEEDRDKTGDANIDGLSNPKDFFVDLYIFAPGQQEFTAKNPPEMPFIEGHTEDVEALHHFYATIERNQMKAESTFPPNPDDQSVWESEWENLDPEGDSVAEVMKSITDTEVHTACVVVDSYVESMEKYNLWPNGYVNEWVETNNFHCEPIQLDFVPVKVCVQPIPDEESHAKEFDKEINGPLKATFMISRTVDRGEDLKVFLDFKGTASVSPTQKNNLPDYRFEEQDGKTIVHVDQTPGWITIPEGKLDVTFEFTPVDDEMQEGDETVKIVIVETEDGPYVPEGVPGTFCQPSAELLIEDDDWYIYLPIVMKE